MTRRREWIPLAVACAAAVLLTACGGPPRAGMASPRTQQLIAIAGGAAVRTLAFPSAAVAADLLDGVDGVIVGGEGWRVPALPEKAEAIAALRQFVERGGRVVLLGYAMALARALGVEDRKPDQCEPFRWGFDGRTASGQARLGFELVSGHLPELQDGMRPAPGHEFGYVLAAGAPLCAPLCSFVQAPPQRGEVLGRLLVQRDGVDEAATAAVVVRWRAGAGAVLGCGIEPDVGAADSDVAGNAQAFLARAVAWLGGERAPRRIDYWLLPDPAPAPLPAQLTAAAAREVPGASPLANWGVVAAVHDGPVPRTPEQIQDEVLLPSLAAGADVLSLDLVDRTQGLPLPWGEHDPLARPKDYRGSAFARGYDGDAFPGLVQEAHARGALVQVLLDPAPGGDEPAARLAALRFVARQWGDLRRLGERAIDGVALRGWFRDGRGLGSAMLQDFAPAAQVVRLGEGTPLLAGAVAAQDARDGQPAGLCALGLAAGFRDGFPGDLFPVGYLDCTARRAPPAADAFVPIGGGTGGDWIAQQAADFVRARRGSGGALLWRAHAPTTLAADTLAYVHGVSMEPLVAAVAARCTTIGTDGWRAAQAALLDESPAGFGATSAAPAGTVMLRNNRFELLGSGGALRFDSRGLCDFGDGAAVLADSFFRTRFFGGRPDADELRTSTQDLLAGGRRPQGGYGLDFVAVAGGAVPTTLAFGAAPRWPQRVDLPLDNDTGAYELQLEARAVTGQGVLAVGVDDAVLALLPFQDGRLAIKRQLALQLARAGHRALRLEVQDGGAVAIDRAVVVRRGDVAAEAEPLVPAGPLATVRERSSSTYHAETVLLSAVADFGGILLRASCERAVRGLQQERRFGLLHHHTLRSVGSGDSERELRRPFVLAADDPELPDLAVVPLQLARYEHFVLDGGALVLVNQPEPGTASVVGFCLLPRDEAAAALPYLGQVFAAIDRPQVLPLGDQGAAELRADLPIAWPRLLQVAQSARTPLLVRENGWWTWRGTEPGPDDTAFVRVLQLPGDAVQILGGQALLARTRPGPGSLHTVALREPSACEVTARVLQRSSLAPPSVTMGDDFDEVSVDGRPWAHWRGRTVVLPDRVGTYRVTTRRHGGDPAPHVLATRAVLDHCAFDPIARELVLVVAAAPERPPELPFTAVLAGPRPQSIDGGQFVDEKDLRHQDATARGEAAAAGVVIRFRPGIVRVRYGR